MPVTNSKNLSLQKKSAARIAAVQCLYKIAVNEEKLDPEKQTKFLRAQLGNNQAEQKITIGAAVEPNYALYETILASVKTYRQEIDKIIASTLSKEWKVERMSPLLLAILQAAIAEMLFGKATPLKIIQDEYSNLTRSFFSEKEVNFVFAALASACQNYDKL